MKCSEALKMLKRNGWYVKSQRGSHLKLVHDECENIIIFPNHGSAELGTGLQKKLFKQGCIK
ncbi:MAG: type II toxin-antitoxin system HicA family toxin [Cytophagales bacterium]